MDESGSTGNVFLMRLSVRVTPALPRASETIHGAAGLHGVIMTKVQELDHATPPC